MKSRARAAAKVPNSKPQVPNPAPENPRPLDVPEECTLVYHDAGDGFALAVEDSKRNVIAYLKWPTAWPKTITSAELKSHGFENV